MIKRRIKRNFDEQLAVVSSLTMTSPKSTNDVTNSKKNRYWSYNKVWRRGESQKRENGGGPAGKVIHETQPRVNGKLIPPSKVKAKSVQPSQDNINPIPPSKVKAKCEPSSQEKVTPIPTSQVKAKSVPLPEVKRGPPQTVRGWRYNRVWRRDRVWKKEYVPLQNLSISSAMTSETKSTVVTSLTQPPVVTSVTQSPSSTSKTSSPAEMCVSDTAKTNSASLTTEKTATFGTHELANVKVSLPPVYDVPCKEPQSPPLSGTEKTLSKTRQNRCSSRDKIPTAETLGVPSAAPPTAGEIERPKKYLKRKRIESQTNTSKRIQLEHSAADSQLTSASYRFLWSMETLFEELCLVFEDVRL